VNLRLSARASSFAALAVLIASCAAQEGDVCFADNDCAGSLVCCKTGGSATERGRCAAEGECGIPFDGGPMVDAGEDGGPPDMDAMVDGGGEDAGEDGGGSDGGGATCTVAGDECGDGYCRATGCGATGTCAARPDTCPGVLAPVCGCDDTTYLSACEAERAGVNVRAEGACASSVPDGGPDGG
jgi:hypothetical protein